jgi:lipoprotein NlpD
VLEGFSEPRNMGIAIEGQPGDPVYAVAEGKVIFSGVGPRGYGNLIIVKHENELLSVYAHNRSLVVREGDQVARGQKIAEIGDSDADRPKLRFEIRREGRPVDPSRYLPARPGQ